MYPIPRSRSTLPVPVLLEELRSQMLTGDYLQGCSKQLSNIRQLIISQKTAVANIKCQQPLPSIGLMGAAADIFLTPHEGDSLFWCFYVIKEGRHKYDMVGTNTFREEKQYKIALVDRIRQVPEVLKAGHFKRKKIEDDLVYQKNISVDTFLCLCRVEGIDIAVVSGRLYHGETQSPTPNIVLLDGKSATIHLLPEVQLAAKWIWYQEHYWGVKDLKKPLRAFSAYKLQQLRDISKRLGLPILGPDGKSLRKIKLYEQITHAL